MKANAYKVASPTVTQEEIGRCGSSPQANHMRNRHEKGAPQSRDPCANAHISGLNTEGNAKFWYLEVCMHIPSLRIEVVLTRLQSHLVSFVAVHVAILVYLLLIYPIVESAIHLIRFYF